MKGGLAASIIAAEAFIKACPQFHGAFEISGTRDEESGGYGGVTYLAEKGFFDPKRVQHVIIPEPLNKDRVCLGHRCGRQGLDQSSWCKDRLYLAGIALGEWLQRTV